MNGGHIRLKFIGLMVAVAAVARARPQTHDLLRMDLSEALGRTVCPLKVVVDDDPLRLPRRIKFMRCDREPERQCAAGGGGGAEALCCRRRGQRLDVVTQCVELLDNVVVQYTERGGADARNATRHVLQVPVGCACVLLAATHAADDD